MKIALIDVNSFQPNSGSRLISALLKREGHSVKLIFLLGSYGAVKHYEDAEIEQLEDVLRDVDFVMISVYSEFAHLAINVTEFIRKRFPGLKIIWGGPHCIGAHEQCLQYADGVCYSEGDQAVIEIAERMKTGNNYYDVKSMAFRINGKNIINEPYPLLTDLDTLPYLDFDMKDHWYLHKKLSPMTAEAMRKYSIQFAGRAGVLHLLTSRGCPHKCSYCINARFGDLYKKSQIRYYSVDRLLNECEIFLKRFPFYNMIAFSDDDFLLRSTEQLQYFASEYKKRIGFPIMIQATANAFNTEKLEILLDAELKAIKIGVESGSQRVVSEVYNRNIKVENTKKIVDQLRPLIDQGRLYLALDFIGDNPYETKDDIILTYKYWLDLPYKRVQLYYNTLVFYPGAPLYKRALADGLIESNDMEYVHAASMSRSILRYQKNYETLLCNIFIFLHHTKLRKIFPKYILRLLGSRVLRYLASIIPESVYKVLILKVKKYQPGMHYDYIALLDQNTKRMQQVSKGDIEPLGTSSA